jgi:di/tricarboxylate transporter
MSGISDTVHKGVEQAKAELRARFVAPLIASAVIWGFAALFGIAGLVFLYVLADRFLVDRLGDPVAAAAILAGANILLVLLMLLVRSLTARKR